MAVHNAGVFPHAARALNEKELAHKCAQVDQGVARVSRFAPGVQVAQSWAIRFDRLLVPFRACRPFISFGPICSLRARRTFRRSFDFRFCRSGGSSWRSSLSRSRIVDVWSIRVYRTLRLRICTRRTRRSVSTVVGCFASASWFDQVDPRERAPDELVAQLRLWIECRKHLESVLSVETTVLGSRPLSMRVRRKSLSRETPGVRGAAPVCRSGTSTLGVTRAGRAVITRPPLSPEAAPPGPLPLTRAGLKGRSPRKRFRAHHATRQCLIRSLKAAAASAEILGPRAALPRACVQD